MTQPTQEDRERARGIGIVTCLAQRWGIPETQNIEADKTYICGVIAEALADKGERVREEMAKAIDDADLWKHPNDYANIRKEVSGVVRSLGAGKTS